jgi:hypothetical protein
MGTDHASSGAGPPHGQALLSGFPSALSARVSSAHDPGEIASRDLMLMAGHCSATAPDSQSTTPCGKQPAGRASAWSSRRCAVRTMLQSLELRARPDVESSLPADAAKAPGWKKTCLQVGGPRLKTWSRFGLLDRGRRPYALRPRWSCSRGFRDMERERARLLICNQ